MKRLHSPICNLKLEYLQASFLMDTDTIIDLYGNTVFELSGSRNSPATQPSFMGLIKCFDDRRSVRLGIISHVTRTDAVDHAFLLKMGPSYNPDKSCEKLFIKMYGHDIYRYATKTVPLVI
jgi:hypothetical protein